MAPSPALETRIRELAADLEKFSEHIVRCRVVLEPPSAHHRAGLFDITIEISVPGEDIAIRTEHRADPSHEDPYVAVRDAFRAARRRLEDYETKQRQSHRAHSQPPR
jgi:ribosome-associated translation inhibitor RaiA